MSSMSRYNEQNSMDYQETIDLNNRKDLSVGAETVISSCPYGSEHVSSAKTNNWFFRL